MKNFIEETLDNERIITMIVTKVTNKTQTESTNKKKKLIENLAGVWTDETIVLLKNNINKASISLLKDLYDLKLFINSDNDLNDDVVLSNDVISATKKGNKYHLIGVYEDSLF